MAENFRRVTKSISAVVPSGTVLYSVPPATTTIGLSLLVSYTGTSSLGYVTAQVSGVAGEGYLVKQAEVLTGSALELVANKLVLQSGDSVLLGGSSSDTLNVTMSYLELS